MGHDAKQVKLSIVGERWVCGSGFVMGLCWNSEMSLIQSNSAIFLLMELCNLVRIDSSLVLVFAHVSVPLM